MMEDFLTYSSLLALLASWGAIYALQRKASAKEKALQTVRRHWEAHLQSEQTLLREVLSDLVAFKRKIAEVKHQSSPETQHPAMQWNKLFGNDVALTAWNWTRFYQVIDVLHEGFRPWLDWTARIPSWTTRKGSFVASLCSVFATKNSPSSSSKALPPS